MSLQLEICYPDHKVRYFPINSLEGWRLDAADQMVVIGKGIGRTYIPYVQITSLRIIEA